MGVDSKKREYGIVRFHVLLLVYVVGVGVVFFILMSDLRIESFATDKKPPALAQDEAFEEDLPAVEGPFGEIVVEDAVEEELPAAEGAFGDIVEDVIEEDLPAAEELVEPISVQEFIVEISRNEFNTGDIDIDVGTIVKWLNKDTKIHKIACYEGSKRIYTDENLENGDSTQYLFDKAGKYLCLDAIFGIRQNINVV